MGVKIREKTKGSGEYWIFVNHKGRRTSKKIGRKKEAMATAEKIRAVLLLSGELPKAEPRTTFGKVADAWLKERADKNRSASTLKRYSGVLDNHVLPVFKKRPIGSIKRYEVEDFLMSLYTAGMKKNGVALVKDVLSGIFGRGVRRELIATNPTAGVMRDLELKDKTRVKNPLKSLDEVELMLEAARSILDYRDYTMLHTGAKTGLRPGELIGLSWGDIDFKNQTARIQRSVRRKVVGPTKTGEVREVDLTPAVVADLMALRKRAKKQSLACGRDIEIIFHSVKDPFQYMRQNRLRRLLRRALDKAGLARRRAHDLRHTYASILLSQGENPLYVSKQLGHANLKTTLEVYAQYLPEEGNRGVDRLDRAVV